MLLYVGTIYALQILKPLRANLYLIKNFGQPIIKIIV